ncbi:MAG: restriction endonuclease [Nanoarchaeota archaeon]
MKIINWISTMLLWKRYEKQILKKVHSKFNDYIVKANDSVIGRYSKVSRQIDISLKRQENEKTVFGVIECKCFSSKINVKTVDSFIGYLHDVGADFGILITNKGFSKAAENRAKGISVKLEIIKFSDWNEFDFSWIDEQTTITPSGNLILRCTKCNSQISFKSEEFDFEVTEVHEREMGSEIYHCASWRGNCNNCDNEIYIFMEIIEYPIGDKTLGNHELEGCELLQNFNF